jgi:glutathione synthase
MNLNSLIHYYVRAYESYSRREPIMVQEYLKSVKQDGDIRILLLNGEIIGAMRRKPKKGDFRTNVHAGGEVFAHRVTAREKQICQVIKEKLIADGLYFVGIDIIAGKLVEVNCVSPGGIPRINRLNNDRLESKVVDFIEKKVSAISHVSHRKRA